MEKSRIFIASSGRTLVLAEKLRDELHADFCEARLWSEEGRSQPGSTIVEMLEKAAEQFDFAVIILAKDDVMGRDPSKTLKARDNCVFEAGLFMAAIGRKRCFLVNSVKHEDLPSDLGGIISIPFIEPPDLSDRDACAKAISKVAAIVKDSVQRDGRSAFHARVPLLSVEELFRRERPHSDGGDLHEGEVVVCDVQPMMGVELALQVGRNIDSGTSYHYFLHFADDTIEKIFQCLQVILVAGSGGADRVTDFNARLGALKAKKDRILDDLRSVCATRRLRITLLADEPQFYFRVHNASNPARAQVYLRYYEHGFLRWTEGASAVTLWRQLPKWLADDEPDRLFIPLKHFDLDGDNLRLFNRSLERALGRYFPGMESEVRQVCTGSRS